MGASSVDQIIGLPKGGGALKGLGETFAPDLHTGTGNFQVPLTLQHGRDGFQPQLTLSYSTGSGNGPFGLGWSLGIPGVARKTSSGVPRYRDRPGAPEGDSDTFILSGSEDLVALGAGALPGSIRYRPRTEGLFARIERVLSQGDDYWRVAGKDGLVSWYGTPRPGGAPAGWQDQAVVARPSNAPPAVFAWRLTATENPFQSRIEYLYEPDEGATADHLGSQPLLRQVRYLDYTDAEGERAYLVTVTLQYEDRPDPFSDHRAGFEVRLTRRCRSILIESHPSREPERPHRPVRRYDLGYRSDEGSGASLLTAVAMVGFDDDGVAVTELPPLTLGYSRFEPARRRFVPVEGPELPAASLGDRAFDLVDLSGQGLPDLVELGQTARYWRNLGGGRFDLPRTMADAPTVGLADPGVQLLDADGDGRPDLVVAGRGQAGYYPMEFGGRWSRRSFRGWARAPSFDLQDPEVRLVDLDGDGVTDAIRAGDRLECFFNHRTEGWREVRAVARQGLDGLPSVSFADPRVKWADMTGDGLQDLVLVHDGAIDYWPNQGHGNFGRRVRMRGSPRFREPGSPAGFDPRRLLLGDVDGDGAADLVYVEDGKVTLWLNRSGNGFGAPVEIHGTPGIGDLDALRLVDLLGNGVAGLLVQTRAGAQGRARLFFLDFTGGHKPYLLDEIDNQLGAVLRIGYEPSTRSWQRDRGDPATRWRTTLPFPVQVVARVEVIDAISGGKLTSEYRYHNGYWDGAEREFRGFGMVEQIDTESFDDYHAASLHQESAFAAVSRRFFSPPTCTRTWFHQGPVEDASGEWRELDLSAGYWPGDPQLLDHTAAVNAFLAGLPDRRSRRDALRSLRGSVLRTELYALDGSERESRPYTVVEKAYGLRAEEDGVAAEAARPPIFFPLALAERTTQWERGDDPMTTFASTGDHDAHGQPRRSTVVAMPRRSQRRAPYTAAVVGTVQANETCLVATEVRTRFAVPDAGIELHDRVAEARTYALESPPEVDERDEQGNDVSGSVAGVLRAQLRAARAVEGQLAALAGARLLRHELHHYDGPAFEGRQVGEVGPYGALTRSEKRVFGSAELDAAYGSARPAYLGGGAPLPEGSPPHFGDDLGYRREEVEPYVAGYYADTVRRRLDFQGAGPPPPDLPAWPAHGLATAIRDPCGGTTTILPDAYWLFPAQVTDAAGLATAATYDYRAFETASRTDPNGHTTHVAFSPAGLVARQWIAGRAGEGGSAERPELEMLHDFLAYARTRGGPAPQPIHAHGRQRIQHASEALGDDVIEAREYSDGFGRLVQRRAQAEALAFGEAGDDVGLPADTAAAPSAAAGGRAADRVLVSGWEVRDNKARVVERYEPFFAASWDYQLQARSGAREEIHYDPRGHMVRTVHPDGSEQRVIYGNPADPRAPDAFEPTPWETTTYDANDLAPLSVGPDGQPLTSVVPPEHHYTPSTALLNGQGKAIAQLACNGQAAEDWHLTRSRYDALGNLVEITDALGRAAFRQAYDQLDRPLRVESIDAGVRTTVPDARGQPAEVRGGKGSVALRQHDALGRLTHLWARDRSDQAVTLRERVEYGDGGPDPDAQRAANRLGRPHRHLDGAGLVVFESYDFKGNVLAETRWAVSDAALARGEGWVPSWSSPGAEGDLEAVGYRTDRSYDALDRTASITCPPDASGHRATLAPSYNRAGALERIALDGSRTVDLIAYNARGQRVLVVYGCGVMTRLRYDGRNFRLKRLRTERFAATAADVWQGRGEPLQDASYEHDLVGNVVAIDERVPGCGVANTVLGRDRLHRAFAYDPLYRLTAADGRACRSAGPRPIEDLPACGSSPARFDPSSAPDLTEPYRETYRYDPAGNLLELAYQAVDGGAWGVRWRRRFGLGGLAPEGWAGAPDDRLTSVDVGATASRLAYDGSGNLTGLDTDQRLAWDHTDRLVGYLRRPEGAAVASVEARYLYGADGSRVKKWVRRNGRATSDESVVYLGGHFEHHRWTEAGLPRENHRVHVMDVRSRVAVVRSGPAEPGEAGPPVQVHLGDHLGSSQVVLGGDGAAASDFLNREEFFPYGETSFGSFARKRYRFTGAERDEESGLACHGARFYAPPLGRWASPDPAGAPDGPNLYAYARNAPLDLVDPGGRQAVTAADAERASPAAPSGDDYQYQAKRDPFERDPTASMSYSRAPEAAAKRAVDQDLWQAGIPVKRDSERYWKEYVARVGGSVSADAGGVQIFYLQGGWEGFLTKAEARGDANRAAWDGRSGKTDVNNALVVFSPNGALLGAYQMAVPNSYPGTARMVASEWSGEKVFTYHNQRWDYEALAVLDTGKLPAFDPGVGKYRYWIDIHHQVGTLGCIEIAGISPQRFDAQVKKWSREYGTMETSYFAKEGGTYVESDRAHGFPVKRRFLGTMSVLRPPAAIQARPR